MWDDFKIDGTQFNQLVEIARAHRLPIFIHLYSQTEARKLLKFSTQNRETAFTIGHMLGLETFKEKRADHPNVFFDTSGSERVHPKDILAAIQSFGDDHVVFGTDTPYAGIDEQICKIDTLPIPDRVKEQIFSLNIKNILPVSFSAIEL